MASGVFRQRFHLRRKARWIGTSAVAGASVVIGQAVETNTATVTIARLVTPFTSPVEVTTVAGLDQVTETDLAQPLGGAEVFSASQVSETDLAQSVGGRRPIIARSFGQFQRLNGRLTISPVRRSIHLGWRPSEGWEQVSDVFIFDQMNNDGSRTVAMSSVAAAWAANSGASAAILKTAINTALHFAGFRGVSGATLD